MFEPAGEPGLAEKPLAQLRIVLPVPEQLDGDQAVDHGIVGEVDQSHPAAAERTANLVPANRSGEIHSSPAARTIAQQSGVR